MFFLTFLLSSTPNLLKKDVYKVGIISREQSYLSNIANEVAKYAVTQLESDNLRVEVVFKTYHNKITFRYKVVCDLVEEGVVAVISVSESAHLALEADVLSQLNIPVISVAATSPFIKTASRTFLVRMAPSDAHQGAAIYSMLKYYNWTEFSILASADDYGINGMIRLLDLIAKDPDMTLVNHLYFDYSDADISSSNYIAQLSLIKDSLCKVIILNCQFDIGKEILGEARKRGLLGIGFVWITTDGITAGSLSPHDEDTYLNGIIGTTPTFQPNAGILKFKRQYSKSMNGSPDSFVWMTFLYDAIKLMHITLNKTVLPEQRVSCSNPEPWPGGKLLLNQITTTRFSGVSGNISFNSEGLIKRKNYEVKNFDEGQFETIGRWSYRQGFTKNKRPVQYLGGSLKKPSSTVNTLYGKHLVMGVVNEPPYSTKNKSMECHGRHHDPECWYGFCIDINNRMAEDLNFTYELREPPDGKYGRFNPDLKRFTGLVYELQERNIDVASALLSINTERSSVIDFLSHITDVQSISVFVNRNEAYNDKFFFLAPLSTYVWLTILGLMLAMGIVITFINTFSPIRLSIDPNIDANKSITRRIFTNIFLVASGFVGREGGDAVPVSPASRFILVAWWFFTTTVISMYTANLTASITLEQSNTNINSLKDLLKQQAFHWGVYEGSATATAISSHKNKEYINLLKLGSSLNNNSEVVRRVRDESFVVIDEDIFLNYLFKDFCNISMFSNDLPTYGISYAVPKNVPHGKILSLALLRYTEMGYIESLRHKWLDFKREENCPDDKLGTSKSFTVKVMSGLFTVLLAAAGISICILCCEIVCYCYQRSNDKSLNITFFAAFRDHFLITARDFPSHSSKEYSDIDNIKLNQI